MAEIIPIATIIFCAGLPFWPAFLYLAWRVDKLRESMAALEIAQKAAIRGEIKMPTANELAGPNV